MEKVRGATDIRKFDQIAETWRPFEHEARLKKLVARQAQFNAALDLDKSDTEAGGSGSRS
jgi:hypothetical protein